MNIGTMALRELAGGESSGECPIEVTTRLTDFQVVQVAGPQGPIAAPAQTLIQFNARRFRELQHDGAPSGIWEFMILIPTKEGAPPAQGRVFIDSADIFSVKALNNLVL